MHACVRDEDTLQAFTRESRQKEGGGREKKIAGENERASQTSQDSGECTSIDTREAGSPHHQTIRQGKQVHGGARHYDSKARRP